MPHRLWSRAQGLRAALVLAIALGLSAGALADIRFNVSQFRVEGDNPLESDLVSGVLQPYLGEHEGMLDLQNAAKSLEELLAAEGYSFHRVVIPPQKTSDGSITFRVIAFRLNELQVEGNDHFDLDNILGSVPLLQPDETPNTRSLERSLLLANANPAKQVGITVKKSERPGYLDATLKIQDRSALEVFAAANNRGSDDTGANRLSLGAQHANLWNRDHNLTLTYTTSPGHWNDVRQYGVNYNIPLYGLAAEIVGFYTYSDVDSGTVAEFFEVSGEGQFFGARYTQHLLSLGPIRHHLRLSIEDRLFDNNTSFNGTPFGADVRSRPMGIEYELDYVAQSGNILFNVGYFRNLARGGFNSNSAYEATRAEADSDWDVWRADGAFDWRFAEKWLLRGRLRAQHADEALIPGEQLGLGGADSVRGFDEREVGTDRGLGASLELWLPPNRTGIQLLTFLDAAKGWQEETQAGEEDDVSLAGAGIGARWRPNQHFTLSLDLGHVLDGAGDARDGRTRLHFNLFSRF